VKDGDMPLDRAKMVAELAQVIINSAKAETDHLKALDKTRGTGFIPEDGGWCHFRSGRRSLRNDS
jgi:hypothetical protein